MNCHILINPVTQFLHLIARRFHSWDSPQDTSTESAKLTHTMWLTFDDGEHNSNITIDGLPILKNINQLITIGQINL